MLNIPVCLGVDEAIADDAINMWTVMKTAGSIHNLTDWDYANWPSAEEVLRAATQTGGLAMREPQLALYPRSTRRFNPYRSARVAVRAIE